MPILERLVQFFLGQHMNYTTISQIRFSSKLENAMDKLALFLYISTIIVRVHTSAMNKDSSRIYVVYVLNKIYIHTVILARRTIGKLIADMLHGRIANSVYLARQALAKLYCGIVFLMPLAFTLPFLLDSGCIQQLVFCALSASILLRISRSFSAGSTFM